MDLRRFGLNDDDLRQLGYQLRGERKADVPPRETPEPVPRPRPGTKRPASPALRIWLATLLALLGGAWASGLGRGLPAPTSVTAPDTAFSSGRALAQLAELAQQPHPTGSPDLDRVRNAIVGRLHALGLDPEIQVATSYVRDSTSVTAATVRNVVARIPGSSATGAVALIAHYDGAPLSPGAGDNGIGTASLLEMVRAVLAGDALKNDLIVVFTDGDELGNLGAAAFRQHPLAEDVVLTVSIDSRGTAGPAMMFESVPGNGALLSALALDENLHHTAFSTAGALSFPTRRGGEGNVVPGSTADVTVTALGKRAWSRQRRDVRELVSERTLQHMGQYLLALGRGAGNLDLRSSPTGPEQVYLSLPRVGLLHFSKVWVLPLSAGLLLGWLGLGGLVRAGRGTPRGVLAGVALALGSVALSAAAAGALFELLASLHPERGFLETAFYRDGPHALALVAASLGITSLLYAIVSRWSRTDEALLGGLAVPVGVTLWLTFSAPGAAPALQWPLAGAIMSALLITSVGPKRARSAWTWSAVLVLSLAGLVVAVPNLELISGVWTLERSRALGALFGLMALLLLPLMDWLRRPRFWATPLVALSAGALLVGLQLPAVQGAARHPTLTTLLYLADRPAITDPRLLATRTAGRTDGSRARTMIGTWVSTQGGDAWARSWVGDPPSGSVDPGLLLLGPDSLYEVIGSAPDAELRPPLVTVLSSTPDAGGTKVVLGVETGLGGEMTGLHLPDGLAAEITGVGDVAFGGGAPVRSVAHWGLPDGGVLRVSVSLPRGTTETEVTVIEHHLRPRDVLGVYFFQRADSLMANAALGSDRLIQRTHVKLFIPDRSPTVEVASPDGGARPGAARDSDD